MPLLQFELEIYVPSNCGKVLLVLRRGLFWDGETGHAVLALVSVCLVVMCKMVFGVDRSHMWTFSWMISGAWI